MAKFMVFKRDVGDEMHAVKDGWSWPAFLFPELATLLKGQVLVWIVALILASVITVISKAGAPIEVILLTRLILFLPFGLFNNRLLQRKLARKGEKMWLSQGIFEGTNENSAIHATKQRSI